SAQLVVIGPDQHAWRRQAFAYRAYREHPTDPDPKAPEYDPVGAEELQVRHTPRLPGHYEWTLQAPDGSVLAQGSCEAKDSGRPRGPVGISPSNRRLLAWAD